jgi:hypothetical protein
MKLDFKHRLTILDFWNTRCSGTYDHFSRINSIKNALGEQVQIVLISTDDVASTQAFFQKNKELLPAVPVAIADTLLARFFPFRTSPHVWIDSKATVKYITYSWNLTEQTIWKVLQGVPLHLSENKYLSDWSTDKPFFSFDSSRYSSVLYYSFIGRCIPGFEIGDRVINTSGKQDHWNRITQNCASPVTLFRLAFSQFKKYNLTPRNTIVFEGVDTSQFMAPPDTSEYYDAWYQQHRFNYDLRIPENRSDQLYTIMQQDLCRFFNVDAKVEKRNIDCYVLITTTKNKRPENISGSLSKFQRSSPDTFVYFRNITLSKLVNSLSQLFPVHHISKPIVDGTQYKEKVNMRLPVSALKFLSIARLNKYLSTYGLKIIERSQLINVLVIRPAKKQKE